MPVALPGVLRDIFAYLPFSVAADAIGINGPPDQGAAVSAVEPTLALVVTVAWLAASLAVAALAAERAEIKKVEPVQAEQPIAAASPEHPNASVEKK